MQKKGIFIQADKKQLLGAMVAKHALEIRGGALAQGIPVTIMLVENYPIFTKYSGISYRRGSKIVEHDPEDLQFFTLSRFMPPELMGFEGRALVIDPDIFALKDIASLFDLDMGGAAVAACRKKDAWDSSVMLLECSKLRHWQIASLLEGLKNRTEDYNEWMWLKKEKVFPIDREWNSLDQFSANTRLLHTTTRLTQPWKTGLPIDFVPGTVPKLFGMIPRFWVPQHTEYQPHPDTRLEQLFFTLVKEALEANAIDRGFITEQIALGNIRQDFLEKVTLA